MKQLILLRHGQSLWNLENKFTGWSDADLCDQGKLEARNAGRLLKSKGYFFDVAYTSVLKRAVRTLWIVMDEMDLMWIPVYRSWQLNERHYGALQGQNKQEMVNQHGSEQVQKWRRSYGTRPPELTHTDRRRLRLDPRYAHLKASEFPRSESLKDTLQRVLPYWKETIAPHLRSGKKVLISAHGNSLRALVKYLDHIADDEIEKFEIPTGLPLVYNLGDNLKPIDHFYVAGNKGQLRYKG